MPPTPRALPWASLCRPCGAPEHRLADLLAGPDELKVYAPQWPTQLSELVASAPADLLASGEAFWQALAVVRVEREDAATFRGVFAEALERLVGLAETDRVEWERLLRMLLGWGLLRRDRREHAGLIEAVRQSHLNALLQEEIAQMIQDLGQTWEQEMLALGRAEGEARGIERGRAEGQLLMGREVLERQLRQRFGELPAEVVQRLTQADLPGLQRALDAVPTLAVLEDLPL
jgi:hypothetical protein